MSHLMTQIILIYKTEAMDMDKEYIKKMYKDTLTIEEQKMMTLLSVCCSEGLSVNVLLNVLNPDNPKAFNSSVDKLCKCNWIFIDYQTIYCDQQIATAILELTTIDTDLAKKVLLGLQRNIVLHPLDDMLSKQGYYVLARLFLTYIMREWVKKAPVDNRFSSLFSKVAIAYACNVELSFCKNKRQSVYQLEDRIDYKLLQFLIGIGSKSEGAASLLLGELYAHIFRYDKARAWFRRAETILGDDAELFMAKARMSENLGLPGKAFLWAWRAYLLNKKNMKDDANIEVCLYISYLCAVNESKANSKYWRGIARSLMGNRSVPCDHIFNITLKEIEALIHLDDAALAHQILDSAELGVYKLYGGDAPEMARISYIRSLVDGETGQLRKSNEHYRRYVYNNHLNYGYSVGDTAVLYSAIINDNVIRCNNQTANIFAIKMQDLYAEGSNIAPGVRLSQAFANCASNLADEVFNLSSAYLEMAQKIYEEELKPDEETLFEIAPVFHDGIIPKSVLMTEEARIINIISINICLGEGRTGDAKKLIEVLLEKETDDNERIKWSIHMGRTLIKEGKHDDALKLWWNLLYKTAKRNRFEICKEIAEWANFYDLKYEAKAFYEQALLFDVMVYAKISDIAQALQCYAHILNYCGFDGSQETWKQAALFMKSMNDKDGLALLYLSWGIAQQDGDAESLIKKAISYWRPEPGIFDETLSSMFHHLSCVQTMQGKHDKALCSAQEAIRLYPTEYPPYLMEEMGMDFPT